MKKDWKKNAPTLQQRTKAGRQHPHPEAVGNLRPEACKPMATGTANDIQQQLALDWLITTAAGTYELSFRSDGDGGERETAFGEGRRFVGLQVVKMVNLPPRLVAEMRKQNAR